MDPLPSPSTQHPSLQTTSPSAFGSSDSGAPDPPRTSHKKLFIISGIILTLLIILGVGLTVWSIQHRNTQLAEQAKRTAAQKAEDERKAKAREGTVNDLTISLKAELKQIQEANDRSIYNESDRLKQEADIASSIGTGNDNGL